jgi:hypothetical protein
MTRVDHPLGDAQRRVPHLGRLRLTLALGAADQEVRGVDAALPQPLAVVRIHRPDRRPDLLRRLEYGRGQLRPCVAMLVAVQECGPATEQVAEPLQLDAQRRSGGCPAPRPPAPLELDVQSDLHPGLEQRLGITVLTLDHRADAVEPAHLDRLEDALVVGRPVAVVIACDHQHAAVVTL